MNHSMPSSSSAASRLGLETRFWRSWGLSVLVHLLVMILLLSLCWSASRTGFEPARQAGIVLTIVDADQRTEYLADSEEVQSRLATQEQELFQLIPSLNPSDEDQAHERLADLNLDARPQAKHDFSPSALPTGVTDMLNATDVSGNVLANDGQLSADAQKRLAQEQARIAALKPVGEPVGLSVFGSETMVGRKFVFVLDQSQSMGSGGLGVLAASKSELVREINKLHDYHQFQIVAYNDRTSVIGKRRLLPATKQNKSKVEQFVESLVAAGGTNHEGGLMVGLGMQPDVLVLLSDGGDPMLDANALALIERLNREQVQIHCLQFGIEANPPADNFMRRLAEQNAGSYRYINVSHWSSNKQ